MKKMLLASAFALFGTFAMANATNVELDEKSVSVEDVVEIVCMPITLSCGVEDCFNYDNSKPLSIYQFWDEVDAQDAYVCGD